MQIERTDFYSVPVQDIERVGFDGEIRDTGVCHTAFFRYAPPSA
jgi:hypothetical protein